MHGTEAGKFPFASYTGQEETQIVLPIVLG